MNIGSVGLSLYLLQVSLLAWIKVAGPFIIFGLYYGFLTTLPVGPSQIISIRSFLLGGNLSGIVAVSGSMMGQLLIFSSIYCSPLYILLVKPHVITLPILPYMLFHWLRTKDLLDYQTLRPIESIKDPRIRNIFLDSLIFQLLNPILLPSPVLARLVHLFYFRYSNSVVFVISSLLGWLVGYTLFSNLSGLLLVRIERDSPILYLLIKRVIYRTFSIIILILIFLNMGKAPVPLFTRKFDEELVLFNRSLRKLPDSILWLFKPWPTSFFDQHKWNRPLRYIVNSRFSRNAPVKRQVSNYFFDNCLTDGKQRVSFTALPSLSIFEKQLKESLNSSDIFLSTDDHYKEWISSKLDRKKALNNESKDRIGSIDTGSTIREAIEKKTGLYTKKRKKLAKIHDPFLSNLYRVRIPTPQSPWILSDLMAPRTDRKNRYGKRYRKGYGNKIQNLVSTKYQGSNRDKIPLPWDVIPKSARRTFLFMFGRSRDIRIKRILNEINILTRKTGLLYITWEQVFKLPPIERALFFIHFREDIGSSNWTYFLDAFPKDSIGIKDSPSSMKRKVSSLPRIEEMQKELPRKTHLIATNRFDIAGGLTDVRNRKLKNLGISVAKTKLKTKRLVKRFSQSSDFRRGLIKGSMRSGRRKVLVWRMFQADAYSPFFLRLMEMPTLFQSPSGESTTSDSGGLTTDRGIGTIKPGENSVSTSSSKNVKKSKADRPAIAARLDIGSIQTGRGLLLVFQSNFRKYVKLPILITLKNLGRISLFQTPEWGEDWSEWNQESHVKCTYDGEEFSDTRLPGRWLKEGLQIKILYPFHLKPWHTHKTKRSSILRENKNIESLGNRESEEENISERRKFEFTYPTAWGFQTNVPFGNIKKQPSFWKPVRKSLRKIWKNTILLRTKRIFQLYTKLGTSTNSESSASTRKFNLYKRSNNIRENYTRTDVTEKNTPSDAQSGEGDAVGIKSNIGIMNRKSIHFDNERKSIDISNEKLLPEIQDRFVLETQTNARKSDNLVTPKIDQIGQITKKSHFSDAGMDRRLRDGDLTINLVLKKQLVQTQQRISRFRRSTAQLIRNRSFSIGIFFGRINRTISHRSTRFFWFNVQLVRVMRDIMGIHRETQHQHLAIPNRDSKFLQVDNNQSMGSISQAYIYDELWHTSTTAKLNLDYLLKTIEEKDWQSIREDPDDDGDWEKDWDSPENSDNSNENRKSLKYYDDKEKSWHFIRDPDSTKERIIYRYIDEQIEDFFITQGLLKEPQDFNENDWNKWLHCLDRYKLPSRMWYKIAPQKWRVKVKEYWKFKEGLLNEQNEYVPYEKQDEYSIYIKDPLLKDRIKNLNKRYKYNYFSYSFPDFTRDANIKGFPVWRNNIEKDSLSRNLIDKLNERKNKRKKTPRILNTQRNFDSESDPMFWLVPDLTERRSVYETESIIVPKTSILQKKTVLSMKEQFRKLSIDYRFQERKVKSDRMYLRERESHYYIFRWKWKSETLERKLQRLKDLISLISILENEQDLTAFCVNMGIDAKSLNMFFTETKREVLNQFLTISAHRLPRIFDDQILMYRMVSTLLKFRNRFRGRLDRDIFNRCISRLSLIDRKIEKGLSYFYNIEDLLLPRRRRESRFLESLPVSKPFGCKKYFPDSDSRMEGMNETQESRDSNQTQKIKRFLWPSYRLEELARINRFWFNTNNGSRFAMLRIRMYPPS
uniref:Ycf1 n=1 Tax=Todea barbara TaxID=90702 RepID=UPI0023D80F82|nr:Ycf1 [Todea barbara]WDE24574.1 Ycf1 [Todea barbara]